MEGKQSKIQHTSFAALAISEKAAGAIVKKCLRLEEMRVKAVEGCLMDEDELNRFKEEEEEEEVVDDEMTPREMEDLP